MSGRDRADRVLVARGVFATRAQAQAAIAAGGVSADGVGVAKPSQLIAHDAVILAEPAHPWVSRAALKLAHALDAFGVDPEGLFCLDVGASTGGFVQVLLARGAAQVAAVDVGRDQLAPALAADPRVLNLERTDARGLVLADLGERPALVTCDASFISLAKVLPAALSVAAEGAWLIALFKPQFEVGPSHVGKRGVVTDIVASQAALAQVVDWLADQGWPVLDRALSPVLGADGNQETLLLARRGGRPSGAGGKA